MDTFGLEQRILTPTHNSGHTLDGICCNLTTLTVKARVSLTSSDHKLIPLEIRYQRMKNGKGRTPTIHNIKPRWKDMAALPNLNREASVCRPKLSGDLAVDNQCFMQWMSTLRDHFAPLAHKITGRSRNPLLHGTPKT